MKTDRTFVSKGFNILLAVFLVLPLLSCSSSSNPVFDPIMAQKLQQSLDSSVEELEIPGAVIGVRAPNGATWFGASGYAVLPQLSADASGKAAVAGEEMTTDRFFHIASVTKTMTATIILQLVDEGKLGLDQTLDQIIARWFAPGYIDFTIPYSDTITLRNLLQMRSGMVDSLATQEGATMLAEHPLDQIDPVEMLRWSAESTDPAPYAPDTAFEYCNANFILQGIIIEQVTGNSYAAEVQSRLLDPLDLGDTSVPDTAAMPSPYAHGYLPSGGVVEDLTESFNPTWGWAAGAIISTAEDLVKWVTALNDGTMISAETQAERLRMLPGVIETWPISYGLGIYDDNGAVGHYGNYNSFYTSYAMRYAGYDFAVLTNGLTVLHSEPGWHAAREVFWNAVRDIGIMQ